MTTKIGSPHNDDDTYMTPSMRPSWLSATLGLKRHLHHPFGRSTHGGWGKGTPIGWDPHHNDDDITNINKVTPVGGGWGPGSGLGGGSPDVGRR